MLSNLLALLIGWMIGWFIGGRLVSQAGSASRVCLMPAQRGSIMKLLLYAMIGGALGRARGISSTSASGAGWARGFPGGRSSSTSRAAS